MKIMLLECSAEELRANRTVSDTITDALSSFTENLVGVKLTSSQVIRAMANMNTKEDENEEVDTQSAD